MSWHSDFLAELYRPVDKCEACGHDIEGHEGFMGNKACIVCDCGHDRDSPQSELVLPWDISGMVIYDG
jgi:hypothetical protein